MKKKKFIIIAAIILLILSLGVVLVSRSKKEPPKEIPKKEPTAVLSIEELPERERPVVSLTARSGGKELVLSIEKIKGIKTVEYELVYLTEGVTRGVIGSVTLKEDEDSLVRGLLLGTCSRGVCRYDKNVTGGTLTVTFRGEKTFKYRKDFKLALEKGETIVVME